jgi:hypothetical protein
MGRTLYRVRIIGGWGIFGRRCTPEYSLDFGSGNLSPWCTAIDRLSECFLNWDTVVLEVHHLIWVDVLCCHGNGNLIIDFCSLNGLFCARIRVALFMHLQRNVIFSIEIECRILNSLFCNWSFFFGRAVLLRLWLVLTGFAWKVQVKVYLNNLRCYLICFPASYVAWFLVETWWMHLLYPGGYIQLELCGWIDLHLVVCTSHVSMLESWKRYHNAKN